MIFENNISLFKNAIGDHSVIILAMPSNKFDCHMQIHKIILAVKD